MSQQLPMESTPERLADKGDGPPGLPPASDIAEALARSSQFADLASKACRSPDYAARGKLLLDSRQLRLGPFPPVDAPPEWSWEMNPLSDRSWQWRLNWLSFISYLLAHHTATGDERAVCVAIEAALSWVRYFPPVEAKHKFEFAWHDHGTALRAEQLGLLIHYVENRSLWSAAKDPTARATLENACLAHGHTLMGERFYSRHTNHGLEQSRVLLMLGVAIRPIVPDEAAQWVETAILRIKAELTHSFTAEGVHVENSPAYHVFVLKVFLGLIDGFRDCGLEALESWREQIGPRAVEYLSRVIRPDGLLPIIGDTEALPVSDSFGRAFAGNPAYLEFLFVQTRGAKGRKPRSLHRIYPQSGYAIFRSDWPVGVEFRQAMHLVFKAGALSNYHRQQDDGSLVLYAFGEDWLIDSGLYNYDEKSPIRQYMRARAAHNVWVLDRQESRLKEPATAWRIIDSNESGPTPFVQAESRAYEGVRMVRRLSMFRKHGFHVHDVIASLDGQAVSGKSLWHVPLDKEVRIVGPTEVLIRSRTSRHQLRIRIQGDAPSEVRTYRGQSTARVLSAISTKTGQSADSQVIWVTYDSSVALFTSMEFNFELPATEGTSQ